MSIVPPPFPWDDDIPLSPNADFSSPGDLIVQLINFHFQIKATRLIFETLPNENAILVDAIPIKDSQFARIVKAIGKISRHCMDSTVLAMTTWRTTMNPFIDFVDIAGSKGKTRTVEEINQGERQGIIVDYIYTEVLRRVIQHYDGTNVKDKTMDSLEETLFKFFISNPHCKSEIALRNREYVKNSFRGIIKQIGKYRIGSILAKFMSNFTTNLKTPLPTLSLIDSLSEVLVNHTLDEEVKASCSVIPTIEANLKVWILKSKKMEQKLGFCSFIGAVLAPLSRAPHNYLSSEIKSQASSLIELIEITIRKSKNKQKNVFILPLAVSVLCACDFSVFNSKFEFFLEQLLLVPYKEQQLRTVCLEALYNLLYASFTKYEEANDSRKQKIRAAVASHLYPANKKSPIPIELDQVDIIIDIIHLLSLYDMDSTITNIIVPYIQSSQPIIPEMIIVAVYSLLRIFKQQGGHVETPLVPFMLNHLVDHPKTRHRKQTLQSLIEITPSDNRLINESQLILLSQFLSQTITVLNQSVGNYTKITDVKHNFDHLPKDKLFLFYSLEAIIAAIQITIPNSVHSTDLFSILTKCTLHCYNGIEINSLQVLKKVIINNPSFRFTIAHCLYKTLLTISDTHQDAIKLFAKYSSELLKLWHGQQLINENFIELNHEYDGIALITEPNFSQLDSLGFFFLCQPNLQTQIAGFEIIKSSKLLFDLISKGHFTTLYSIIINHGAEVIAMSFTSKSLFTEVEPIPSKIPNFDEVLKANDTSEAARLRYSRILAKLFNYVVIGGTIDTAKAFIKIIKDRIPPCQHLLEHHHLKHEDLNSSNIISNHNVSNQSSGDILFLWRNYISIACAACEVIDTNIFDASNVVAGDHQTIESSRDLFKLIIPFVRNENHDRRFAVESALSYLLPAVKNSLILELSQYEKIAFHEDKTKSKLKTHNAIILSYIYRIIIENMSKGTLLENDSTNLKIFFAIIRHQLEKCADNSVLNFESPLDVQFWHYNLCLSIKLLFEEINTVKQLNCREEYDQDLFENCFLFLTRCSGYADYDKVKERKALLNYIKDKSYDEREYSKTLFEDQTNALQFAASEALIQLCYSPCDEEEQKRKLNWIGNVFATGPKNMQYTARKALINLLRSNKERKTSLFATIVDECYNADNNKGINNFMVISEIYQTGKLPLYPAVLLTLGLHKLCDSNYEVRQIAIKFMQNMLKQCFPGEYSFAESATIYDTYQANQLEVASKIAKNYPAISFEFIVESLIRFRSVDDVARERLLKIMVPFFLNIILSKLAENQILSILETLCIITFKYAEQFTSTIEKIWATLANSHENIVTILNYLISVSTVRRNKNIISVGEKVTLLLARVLPKEVIKKLIYELFSTNRIGRMITVEEHREISAKEMEEQSNTKPSWAKDAMFVFPAILKNKPFSRSNISLLFIQGIILENFEEMKEFIPFIFSVIILSMDLGNEEVNSSIKLIINNLYFHNKEVNLEKEYWKLLEIIDKGWNKLDFNNGIIEKNNNKMSEFINLLIRFVKPLLGDINQQLTMCSLKWAYTSDSSHLVCRSLQIYRYLNPPVTNDTLYYLLAIFNNHLTNRNPKSNQNIILEVLLSLQVSAEKSEDNAKTMTYSQIWSTALLSLQSDNEKEFSVAVQLITTLLNHCNLNDPSILQKLSNSSFLKGSNIVKGIQPMILKGLSSPNTEEVSRILLSKLSTIKIDSLIDPSVTKVVDNVTSLLPFILQNYYFSDDKDEVKYSSQVALQLADQFEKLNFPVLSSSLAKFSNGGYKDGSEFLNDFKRAFYDNFVKGNDVRVFSTLFYSVINGVRKYKTSTLLVFESLIGLVDLTSPNCPITKQMMGTFYHLLNELEQENWVDVIALFDVIVENSTSVEKFEFAVLPNPSSVAKIIEKVEPVRSPWTESDINKPTILPLLQDALKTLKDPNFFNLNEFGELVKEVQPAVSKNQNYSHAEPSNSNVLNAKKKLLFSEEIKKFKKYDHHTFHPPPEYEAPHRPVVVPPPNAPRMQIGGDRLRTKANIEN